MDQEENAAPPGAENLNRPSILDTVSLSRQNAALRAFNPQGLIMEYLEKLSQREKQILTSRYGLLDGNSLTLENIGKKMNLTRERVRQIEKDALKKLNQMTPPQNFLGGSDLVLQIIEENGNAMREDKIFEVVLANNDTSVGRMGILFILNLLPRFHLIKETNEFHRTWTLPAFDRQIFDETINAAFDALQKTGKPVARAELLQKFSSMPELQNVSVEAFESYLAISEKISKNPWEEWGLSSWTEIHPKDVGDKAFLVLTHLGKPEHYAKITELINKSKFDDRRIAQKETVHNELIKDKRFILVGRGIYALSSWGYKSGVVADIIEDILKKATQPLEKDEIIEKVLLQRLVKRNTVIVGLSNKGRFKKVAENKYTLAPKDNV